jgi:ABC-2 type transport system ATP-binding protein
VALVQQGRLLAIDAPSAIGDRFPLPLFAIHGHDRYAMMGALRSFPHVSTVLPFGEVLHYADTRNGEPAVSIADEVTAWLHARGFSDARVTPIRPGIEDAFMALMGAPREAAA